MSKRTHYADGVPVQRDEWEVFKGGEWQGMVIADTRADARAKALNRYAGWGKGERITVRRIAKRARTRKRNPSKAVRLKNFSGTITRNADGTVTIKGRKR